MKDISERTRKLIGSYVVLGEEEDSWLLLSKSQRNGGQAIHLSKSAHHEIFKVLTGADMSSEDTERIINLDCFKRLVTSDEDSDADAAQKRRLDNSDSRYVIKPNTELIDKEIKETKLDEFKNEGWNSEVDYVCCGITDTSEPSDDGLDKSEESLEHALLGDLFHMLTSMNNTINCNDGMNYSLVLFNVYRTCHLLNERISQMPNMFTQSSKYASFGIAFFNELAAAFEYLDENFPSGIFDVDLIASDIYYLTGLRNDTESVLREDNPYLKKKGSIKMTEELLSRTDLMKQKYFNRFPFCPADGPFSAKSGKFYDEVKKLHGDHWILVKRGVYCQQPRVSLQPKFAKQVKLIHSKLNISEVDRCPECNVLLSETEFAVLRECDHLICLRCAELHSTKLASNSVSTWHFYCPICEAKVKAWSSSLHLPATRPNLLTKIKPLAALFGSQVFIIAVLYGLKKGVLTM